MRENLINLSFENARKKELKDRDYRIVKIDGKAIITSDFKTDRLNLEIENGIIVNVYEG